jgi:hypothetical protein
VSKFEPLRVSKCMLLAGMTCVALLIFYNEPPSPDGPAGDHVITQLWHMSTIHGV